MTYVTCVVLWLVVYFSESIAERGKPFQCNIVSLITVVRRLSSSCSIVRRLAVVLTCCVICTVLHCLCRWALVGTCLQRCVHIVNISITFWGKIISQSRMTLWIISSNNTLAGYIGNECRLGNWLLLLVYVGLMTRTLLCGPLCVAISWNGADVCLSVRLSVCLSRVISRKRSQIEP